jgi:UDP-3-O-[3-hydroxymyristoyl] N-acetylglucosamine deacetylase/3-hydroxyacyl-[acyl-carrier-protein] dehydratase
LRGHLIAVKPSHAANCELVRLVSAQMRRPLAAAQAFGPPPTAPAGEAAGKAAPAEGGDSETVLDAEQVMNLLPHRYPFLMIDRVTKMDGDFITAVKNVTINEPFFQGHFPGHPIMPGVLQLEAIAQVAGILMMKRSETGGHLAYFMSAEDVKWRKPVTPGDVLVIEVEMTRVRGKIAKAKGVCKVRGDIVSEATVTFMLWENP